MADYEMPGTFPFPPRYHQLPLPLAAAPCQPSQGGYAAASASLAAQMPPYSVAAVPTTVGPRDPPTSSVMRGGGLAAAPPSAAPGSVAASTREREPAAAPRQEEGPAVAFPSNPHASKPIRRRMRIITSCLECRRRKLKCDKAHPCHNCVKFTRDCVFLGPKLDEASQQRLTEIKERVGSLEKQLERDVAKGRDSPDGDGFCQQRIVADDVEDDFGEERGLHITPVVALDLTYEDDTDGIGIGTGELGDLGIRVGRMRITDRIGGLSRPRMWEEIQAGISGAQTTSNYGSSPKLPNNPTGELPDFLKPGESYIPPTSGFFFGLVTGLPALLQLLPTAEMGNRLIHRYFEAVHPIARCVHRPSFEAMYQSFWDCVRDNVEPRAPIQAVVFAAWFSAAVSLDEIRAQHEYGHTKTQVVLSMRIATETALTRAKFLSTTSVDTLQAFVMYMLPLCRDEVSRAHSVLVGAAIRMAECMGLHQDGSAYGLSPLETHVRRLIWHQLCFLDIRTCEAQGPKPTIRRDEYTTKFPLNCDEAELTPHTMVAPAMAERWTPALLSIIRFEVNAMMRTIWANRSRPEPKKLTLTSMLAKVEKFRKRMFDKYNRFLDEQVPIQKYTKLVMQLLMYRLHAMILHPFHANARHPLPDKLNGLLITSGIFIIETAIQLESSALFRDWAWYLGAYQQYQIALLLATEIYYRPDNKDAQRIWPCLDYVFKMDPNMPREQKSLQILTEIKDKTSVYMSMRKVRAPTAISKAVLSKQAVKEPTPPRPLRPPAAALVPPMPTRGQPPFQRAGTVGLQGSSACTTTAVSEAVSGAVSAGMSTTPTIASGRGAQLRQPPSYTAPPPPPHMTWAQQSMGIPTPMVYSGLSDGEVLWRLPPSANNNHASPGSSDGENGAGQQQQQGSMAGPPGRGPAGPMNAMDNIDWDEINMLFPTDPHTGELSFNTFVDPAARMASAGAWPRQ
ncbi:hypothetical protein MFIFM68171_00656 [Madurella fahalii]|uniref:Zn(2)-C6 fungal-type domain-containing protein n=1 Tax=Madurella fahalii TaxID=1157608 RepID=A0ABQ0FY49_9PEZI